MDGDLPSFSFYIVLSWVKIRTREVLWRRALLSSLVFALKLCRNSEEAVPAHFTFVVKLRNCDKRGEKKCVGRVVYRDWPCDGVTWRLQVFAHLNLKAQHRWARQAPVRNGENCTELKIAAFFVCIIRITAKDHIAIAINHAALIHAIQRAGKSLDWGTAEHVHSI